MQFPCCRQTLRNEVVNYDIFLSFCLHHASALLPAYTPVYLVLFLSLSLGSPPVYRKSSRPTNKHWPHSSTSRQEMMERSGRALRSCCITFPRDPSATPTHCTSLAALYSRKDRCLKMSAWAKTMEGASIWGAEAPSQLDRSCVFLQHKRVTLDLWFHKSSDQHDKRLSVN